ncbi:hypothetical protein F383_31038 [Gossypium arboreum]|uniref:Uncharacterized protein n=1 Tax=Gossypium arboreum TaxID=29729 RepID=A0A0B0PDS3_GOSAR|nr:hypothetical protein F383_27605 [Gossypium arboreum]KHG24425.1 hypothetical protein F383_31038 [Gossypium arboreum]
MFSKMVKLVDLLIKLKELKKENQARERRRSSSSRLGLFLPNTSGKSKYLEFMANRCYVHARGGVGSLGSSPFGCS